MYAPLTDTVIRRIATSFDTDVIPDDIDRVVQQRLEADSAYGELNELQRLLVGDAVRDELTGLGPLEPVLRDPEVDAILIHAPDRVAVLRRGAVVSTNITFWHDDHVARMLSRLRSTDRASESCDADGVIVLTPRRSSKA